MQPTTAGIYRGLLSGIVFAGANGKGPAQGPQAILSALELSGLDLSECELVTLSACETNVGPRLLGEAVSGLNRALHLAGARNTITSLWPVSDRDTRLFFEAMYGALWGPGDKARDLAEAFERARSSLRDARLPAQVWAGFVLYTTGP